MFAPRLCPLGARFTGGRCSPMPQLTTPALVALQSRVRALTDQYPDAGLRPHASLERHRAMAQIYLAAAYQPDETLGREDIRNLPLLIEAENSRNPGLNLHYCAGPGAFVDWLHALAVDPHNNVRHRARAIVQVDDWSPHHVVADIHCRGSEPVSVILLDSSVMPHHFPPWVEREMGARGVDCRVAGDGASVQQSSNDCVMFALSFALKFHQHQRRFDDCHERQCDQAGYRWSVFQDGLPAEFYKHAQSAKPLQWIAPRQQFADQVINKRGEVLAQRQARFTGEFLSARYFDVKTCSNSIEHKRMVFIDRARHHAQQQASTDGLAPLRQQIERGLQWARSFVAQAMS